MIQDWERIGDLMVTAIRHWATFRPKMTLELYKAGTLGARALADSKATMEQVYRATDKFGRMDIWEAVREDRILLTEEADYSEPTNEAARVVKMKKLDLGEAVGVVDDALEAAKLDWSWNPSKKQELAINEEEEEMEFDPENFTLTEKDEQAITVAQIIARLLLRQTRIKPTDVVVIGKAMYALGRMPLTTPGAEFSFGVTLRGGDSDYSETAYISFTITSSSFEIARGGSSYDRLVGGDHYSSPGYLIEVGGHRCCECEVGGLEEEVTYDYLANDCTIDTCDGSDENFSMADVP